MINKEKLKHFLLNIEKFYQPEHPELKEGIGHEIEHIKGVVHRTEEIVKTINNNPEKCNTNLDLLVATTIACLHDIGNVISRDGHNFFGEGILKGSLSIESCIVNNKKNSHNINKNVLEGYIHLKNNDISYNELTKQQKDNILKATVFYIKFNMSYNGYNEQSVSVDDFDIFLSTLSNLPKDENLVFKIKEELIKDGQFKEDDCHYTPELKNITKQFQEIFPLNSKEFNDIVRAVREHNIDFMENEKGEKFRFVSDSPYSRIIADADKDNIPETFAMRTMLFALNKWIKSKCNPAFIEKDEKGELKVDENGEYVPNLDMCARHVAHQANERFKYSKEEWMKETGKNENVPNFAYEVAKEFNSESGYKPLKKIKGVDSKGISSPEKGDDLFSQVDTFYGGHEIENLRKSAIDTLRKWSRPDRIEQSMSELRPIMQELLKAPSIETAVDIYESKYYDNVGHNSFEEIIDNIIKEAEEIEEEKEWSQWKGITESKKISDFAEKPKYFIGDIDDALSNCDIDSNNVEDISDDFDNIR